ncbi:hypothetical protein GCM10011509_28930 [Ornithinimicrobium pekingense]|uniref:Uncharacterized protein n=1 Tax=Ornithinimicrobium pekingense TaxID=384677 RepID=A0ABQ2FES6_9MICO|nr:hypothetical protein GCM10011509_28930 [Ornithinimicrobium pekingense]
MLGSDRVTTTVLSSGASTDSTMSSWAARLIVQASEETCSRENFASSAVNSEPSEKVTPSSRVKV